jgi:hypothetical protein
MNASFAIILLFAAFYTCLSTPDCHPNSDTCNLPQSDTLRAEANDKELLLQSILHVHNSTDGDKGDLEEGAVREAIEHVCSNIPTIVDMCYPDCSQASDEQGAGECFGQCVHDHLMNHFEENATALFEKNSRMKLRAAAIFKDMKQIPTKAQVIEYMEGECMNMDEGEAETRAKAAVCPHAEELVDLCYPPCEHSSEGESCFKRCIHGALSKETSLAQTQLRHLAGFRASAGQPTKAEVLDGVNKWCDGDDDNNNDNGDHVDNGDLEEGAVREAIEHVCSNIPTIVDLCYPDCSQASDEQGAGECFGHCVHDHLMNHFEQDATALFEKKSRMKLRAAAIFKDMKQIPTKAQVIEYMQGECLNMEEGEAETRAKAAVCPHAEELVEYCYPQCGRSSQGEVEHCFKTCIHDKLSGGASLAQTQLRHLVSFKALPEGKPTIDEIKNEVNKWCEGGHDDNGDHDGPPCEGMQDCPADWRCERPTDAIGYCEPCRSVPGHLTTDCNVGSPTTPMMGGRGPAMPTGPMMGDGPGPMDRR